MNEHNGLAVYNFALDTAFIELSRIFQSEGAEQAGKDLLVILKGADDELEKRELLKRFYQLSEEMAVQNPNALLSILRGGSTLKQIYTYLNVVLDETIDGVSNVSSDSVYIVQFLKNDITDVIQDIRQSYSLSDEVIFSGSVVSVLLRAIYDEHIANVAILDKKIKRKESLTKKDLTETREMEFLKLKEHLSSSLKEVKRSIFADEYANTLDELRSFLYGAKEGGLEDLGELATQIKKLRKEMQGKDFSSQEIHDTDVILETSNREAQDAVIESESSPQFDRGIGSGTIEKLEEFMESMTQGLLMLARGSDVDELSEELALVKQMLISKQSEESGVNRDEINEGLTFDNREEKSSSASSESISSVLDRIEELEITMRNYFEEAIESAPNQKEKPILDSPISNEAFADIEAVLTEIRSDISDNKEEITNEMRQSISSIKETIKEASDLNPTQEISLPSDDVSEDIAGLVNSVNELTEKMDSMEKQNIEMSHNIASILEILTSVGQDIQSEIEVAKKYRKDNKYE